MKVKLDLNSTAEDLFDDWIVAVNAKREKRICYTEFKELKTIFMSRRCPTCNGILYTVVVESHDFGKTSVILCDECGTSYVLPDFMTRKIFAGEQEEEEEVTDIEDNIKIKGECNMFNTNAMFKGMEFGPVNGDSYKMSALGVAFKSETGYVVYNAKKEEITDVTGMTFDMDGMIFAMPVSHKKVKAGDIIVHGKKTVIVKEVKAKTIIVVHPFDGEIKEIVPIKNMFGFNFYTKISPLMDMTSITKPDEDSPFGDMMPMMMMSQMGNTKGKDGGMNPMMMMAMMGGDDSGMSKEMLMMMAMSGNSGESNNMMQMMMMSKMMK